MISARSQRGPRLRIKDSDAGRKVKDEGLRASPQVTLPNAVAILAEHWDDVAGRLHDDQRQLLAALTGELLGADDVGRRNAAMDIMDLVSPVLPADHPVRRALATESRRFGHSSGQWEAALLILRPRLAEMRLAIGLSASPAEVKREAERWVLAVPALDPVEVRLRGADPDDPGLIRLDPPGGSTQLPAFQFGSDGLPYPVVTAINILLDARDDPWGAADWWLGPNAWIGAVPAEVIGQIDDQVLIEAAQAVFEEA